MKEIEFLLPPENSAANKNFYNFLINLFNKLKEKKNHRIILNFKTVISFDPTLCASLAVILDYLMMKKKHRFVFRHMPNSLIIIFKNNGFLSKLNIIPGANYKNLNPTIRFSKINAKKENFCKAYLINEFRFLSKDVSQNESTRKLIRSLLEIFKNIPKHGGKKSKNTGYICGHFFSEKKMVIITIANWGFTFKSNYFIKQKKFKTNGEAITYSLKKGATSRDINTETGGLGFSLIREFLKDVNGSLAIISGDGLIEEFNSSFKNSELLIDGYPGSVVSLAFSTNSPFFLENNTIDNIKEEQIIL